MNALQVGDIILIKKVGGFRFISDVLLWWQNSKIVSHVGIITSVDPLQVFDTRMGQRSKIINLDYFFDGQHTIRIIRYNPELTDNQKMNIVSYLKRNCNIKYDNISILSLIINRGIENKKRLNCGEATLLAYQEAGLLKKRDVDYILPHTFWEYYIADRFNLIQSLVKPNKEEIKILYKT